MPCFPMKLHFQAKYELRFKSDGQEISTIE